MKHTLCRITFFSLLSLCGVAFSACATYKLEVSNVSLYNEGVQIVDSIKTKSKVRLEVGQHKVGSASSIPLALFVSAANLSAQSVIFDRNNVLLYQNGKLLPSLSNEEIKSGSFDYSYIIESYHLYIPPAPVPSQSVVIASPFIYRGYWGGGSYIYNDMVFSARERMQRRIELEEQRAKRAIIISSALQKNTLEPKGMPRGGFVIYSPSVLQVGELDIRVRVGVEEHSFTLEIVK